MPCGTVSVVIPIYNSARTLGLCLEALAHSTILPLECIVVDDASTDDSVAVARKYGARVLQLEQRSGPARARNFGAAHAQGEVVLFLDADVCAHSDTLERVIAYFEQDPELDGVIGSYDDSPSASTFVSQYRNLLHCFTHGTSQQRASTFWGGCGAIRRSVFLRLKGFDERFDRSSIEDIEFGARLTAQGGRILLDPKIQVQHLKRWTFFGMLWTDIFDRGIPWTRLILRNGSMPTNLAVRASQRASIAAATLSVAMVCLGYPGLSLGCALICIALNAKFYKFLAMRRGILFAICAAPLHVLFFLYSGVAFVAGAIAHVVSPIPHHRGVG